MPLDHETLEGANLQQVLDRWLSRRNLFDDRFPVSGRHFYGRELELRQIRANIDDGRHTGIYGLRKVGKTSLLYQLRGTRPLDLVVYVDLQEIRGPASRTAPTCSGRSAAGCTRSWPSGSCWTRSRSTRTLQLGAVRTYTAIRQPQNNALRFDEDLSRLLDALDADPTLPDIKVVITIDELEYMLPISDANPGFRGYADFFAYLRGVGQRTRGRVVSVVTAANPLVSETPNWGSRENPVFQFYQDVFLPPLDEDVCAEMVQQLGRGMGVSFDQDSLALVYREAGGHPYITRQLCGHIVRGYDYRPLRITRQIVEREPRDVRARQGRDLRGDPLPPGDPLPGGERAAAVHRRRRRRAGRAGDALGPADRAGAAPPAGVPDRGVRRRRVPDQDPPAASLAAPVPARTGGLDRAARE